MNPILATAAELETELITSDLDDADRDAGHRYLAGLTRWALERALVGSDPSYPAFARCMDTVSKWGLENPDNIYRSARISAEAEYLITGHRGSCADLAFEVLTGLAGDDGTTGQPVSALELDSLRIDADGRYRIRVGGPAPSTGNHLATGEGASEVFVRHTFGDWGCEDAGDIVITRLSPAGPRTPVADLLEHGARTLRNQAGFMTAFADGWRAQVPVNAVTPPQGYQGGGFMPGQYNAVGQFSVPSDSALVFRFDPVPCRYWSFGLGHHRWFVSFDYRIRHCHLNSTQLRVSADGAVYVVLAASDPGVPNWLDCGGERGFIFLRWQGVRAAEPARPDATLVPLQAVRDHLPPGEPHVTGAERAATIAERRAAVDRR